NISTLLRKPVGDGIIITLIRDKYVFFQLQPGRPVNRAEGKANPVFLIRFPEQERSAFRAAPAFGAGTGNIPLHIPGDAEFILMHPGRGPYAAGLFAALSTMTGRDFAWCS